MSVGYDLERISRNPFTHFVLLCKKSCPEVKIYMEICFTDATGYWIRFTAHFPHSLLSPNCKEMLFAYILGAKSYLHNVFGYNTL